MGRDRFVAIEWGDVQGKRNHEFGFCDSGFRLDSCSEQELYQQLKSQGYTVRKHGWPDFIARKGDEIRLIESKAATERLKQSQKDTFDALQKLGITVEIIRREPRPSPEKDK